MRFMAYIWNGEARKKNAKPASAEGPRSKRSRIRQMIIWIGAAHDYRRLLSELEFLEIHSSPKEHTVWKWKQQKSIRETSVDMWFTNFPLGRVERARAVNLVQRLYIAVMRPPLRRTPVDKLRYKHWFMQRDEITWRKNSTKTSPTPLPMPGTGKPCCWFANDSEAKLTIAFEYLSMDEEDGNNKISPLPQVGWLSGPYQQQLWKGLQTKTTIWCCHS